MTLQRIVTCLFTPALLASVLIGTAACGLLLTHGSPAGRQQLSEFTCTKSNLGPILDGIEAGGGVVLALASASTPSSSYGPSGGGAVASFLAMGAFYGVSAAVGFHKTSACRAARRQWPRPQTAPKVSGAVPSN